LGVPLCALGVAAVLVALPGGCSRGSTPTAPATVRGTITFQGRPLAGGLVVFSPDKDRGGSGKPGRGDIGPDGRYELRLQGEPAIPSGWYRVAIAAAPTGEHTSTIKLTAFPAELARPDLSGLVREVKPGNENVFDFAIELSGR